MRCASLTTAAVPPGHCSSGHQGRAWTVQIWRDLLMDVTPSIMKRRFTHPESVPPRVLLPPGLPTTGRWKSRWEVVWPSLSRLPSFSCSKLRDRLVSECSGWPHSLNGHTTARNSYTNPSLWVPQNHLTLSQHGWDLTIIFSHRNLIFQYYWIFKNQNPQAKILLQWIKKFYQTSCHFPNERVTYRQP